jgi:hypothetical protein
MNTQTPKVSPLRQRMIEDMRIRKLEPKTQSGYIRAVRHFTIWFGRSPDQAGPEDLRLFQLHVLPSGFHRIRHYGMLANANRKLDIATVRALLHQPPPVPVADGSTDHGCPRPTFVCRHCGAPMLVIETFARAPHIRGPPC